MSDFKNNIRELLEKKGITQKELANLIGVTETVISRYVNGNRIPKATTGIKIAKALDCTVEELYILQKEKASRGMTEQEAVENFKGENKILSQYAESKFQKEVFAKKIERNNIAIQALEKKIAKKPHEIVDLFGDIEYICRVCGEIIEKNYYAYCPTCGQKLDWGEEE